MSRIVDRRVAESGVVEYRLRAGPRSPLEETPETDTWKVWTTMRVVLCLPYRSVPVAASVSVSVSVSASASVCFSQSPPEYRGFVPPVSLRRRQNATLQWSPRRRRGSARRRHRSFGPSSVILRRREAGDASVGLRTSVSRSSPAHAAFSPLVSHVCVRPTAIVEELDLPSVPEYNPTPEQFKDPLAYIQTIYDQAALYGVCIINPPKESWNVSVGPKDWESACKTSGRMSAFAVKRQKLLNAQRKTGDPGFEYLKNELNLAQYEKETHRVQEKVRKTLPRPVNIDDEIDVETNFFDTMAREAGTS